mgnify:CR=1 FL=1
MNIYPRGESINQKKVVKFGIDPTGNRLHLGHFVSIRFLWKMIEEHRDVVVVLGTQTGLIGDPSGTVKEREKVSRDIIFSNANELEKQIKKLLPLARIVRNHEIFETFGVSGFISALGEFTINKLQDRAALQNRNARIDEFVVPVLQALDSVFLGAEIEVGGEDQEFNFSITRELQRLWKQTPETCVLIPIIRGTDGRKMSKSLGNCVYLDDGDIHGKIMSIPDDVMDEWLPLLTDTKDYPSHPKERKEFLSAEVVKLIHQ